jgi:serine/threonine protein phosphatase PrpC
MDAQGFFQVDMLKVQTYPIAEGEAGVFSAPSSDKQTPNEDAAALISVDHRTGILVVADGLGGSPAGEQASCLAVRKMISSIRELSAEEPDLRAAILDGIEAANRAVSELGCGAATTLAVAEIRDHAVRSYHVGDSMILVVGQRGKIKLQTISHSPVGYALEAGMLDEAEAMHHAERHVVSNTIGAADMRIEVGPTVRLAPRDTLLLATDGLFDNLHTEEIVERIRKGPLPHAVRRLVEDCRRRMQTAEEGQPSKPDDLTFIAFRRLPPKPRRKEG